jgi:hypothetical protein
VDGIGRVQGAQPVDFAAMLLDEAVALVEAKDYRRHATALKKKLSSGELAHRIASKFRDSLAGIIWSGARETTSSDVERILGGLFRREPPKLLLVVWLDDDLNDPAIADSVRSEIESRLPRKLVYRIVVTSLRLEKESKHPLSWLRATSLPKTSSS